MHQNHLPDVTKVTYFLCCRMKNPAMKITKQMATRIDNFLDWQPLMLHRS